MTKSNNEIIAEFHKKIEEVIRDKKIDLEDKLEILEKELKSNKDLLIGGISESGNRALDVAILSKSKDVVRFFIRNGAKIDEPNGVGPTATELAEGRSDGMLRAIQRSHAIKSRIVPSLCRMIKGGDIHEDMKNSINGILEKAIGGAKKYQDDLLDIVHGVGDDGLSPYQLMTTSKDKAVKDFAVKLVIKLNTPPLKKGKDTTIKSSIVPLLNDMIENDDLHDDMKNYMHEIITGAEDGSQSDFDILNKIGYGSDDKGRSPFTLAKSSPHQNVQDFLASIEVRTNNPEFIRTPRTPEQKLEHLIFKTIKANDVAGIEAIVNDPEFVGEDKKWRRVFDYAIELDNRPILERAIAIRLLHQENGKNKEAKERKEVLPYEYRNELDIIRNYCPRVQTLLHQAATFNSSQTAEFLFGVIKSNGVASDELCDFKGDTPLNVAARRCSDKVAKILLEQPISEVVNLKGETPLHVIFLEKQQNRETSMKAWEDKLLVTVELLLKNNPNLEALDEKNNTPLQNLRNNKQMDGVAGKIEEMFEESKKRFVLSNSVQKMVAKQVSENREYQKSV